MRRLQILCAALAAALFGLPPAASAAGAVAQYGHVLFVTSGSYSIDAAANPMPSDDSFGGLLAADWLVTQAAASAGYVPNWNGQDRVFKALLSTDTVNARDRAAIQGPVYNTAGELLAANEADLWDGVLVAGVNYTEQRQQLPPVTLFWSGSTAFGVAEATAGNWTDPAGQANVGFTGVTQNWFSQGQILATGARRLVGIGPRDLLDPGDLDSDNDVDGDDFLLWQRGVGRSGANLTLADGDANGDLAVNSADLAILKQNFGRQYGPLSFQGGGAAMAIPEPSSLVAGLLALGVLVAASRRRGER